MATQTFPQFSDGNVEINFSGTDDKFVLHSWALALHSSWFKAALSERWNTGNNENLLGGRNHWIYELRFDKNSDIGLLMRKTTPGVASSTDTEFIPGSKAQLANTATESDKTLHKARLACIKAHQDLLGMIYYVSPTFSHSSFETAKLSIMGIAKLAETYGCEHVTKIHIENHLRLYKAEVLELCATDPVSMLQLAIATRSEWIFMEAATNLIGGAQASFDLALEDLKELQIADLMEKKRSLFKATLRDCEFDMFQIQARSQENRWPIHFAVSFFRQWLTEQLSLGQGSRLAFGYAQLYHMVAYRLPPPPYVFGPLPIEQHMVKFYGSATPAGIEVVSQEVTRIFAAAAAIIQPILIDKTRRQDKSNPMQRNLTFMGIEDEEIPWFKK